jgi:Ala-tRNA(Pro) deacylase
VTGDLGPALLDCGELYVNAGRLDRSVALASEDYLRLAGPRIARIIATCPRLPGHGR